MSLPGVPVLFCERVISFVVEGLQIMSMEEAVGSRWRADEYTRRFGRGSAPLWKVEGNVAYVVDELLNLPHPMPRVLRVEWFSAQAA